MVATRLKAQVTDPPAGQGLERVPGPWWARRQTLTAAEAHQVLVASAATYQVAFALGVLLGLPKREVLALRGTDYDPVARTLAIRARATGAWGRPRVLPVSPELDTYLRPHAAEAPDLLFPSATGRMHDPRSKLHERVRAAIKRAGLYAGYDRICRRCRSRERAPDGSPGRCARCDFRLWVEPVPRALTFLDLRATFARLADEASVPPSAQRYSMGLCAAPHDRDWSADPVALRTELEKLHLAAAG